MPVKTIASPIAIQVAMVFSLIIHMTLLAIEFSIPDNTNPNKLAELEIILVNSKSLVAPVQTRMVAQVSLNGGGNTREDIKSRTNLSERQMLAEEFIQTSSKRIASLEDQARRLIETLDGVLTNDLENQAVPSHRSKEVVNVDASNINTDIARLRTQISRDWSEYQRMPKRDFIGVQANEVIYAEYVDKWVEKIEDIGTKNFPRSGGQEGVYGSLLVTVSIRADGSLEEVRVDKGSGNIDLDRAVETIVKLSSPFAPFTQKMKQKTDILSITRNWRFTRSDLDIVEGL